MDTGKNAGIDSHIEKPLTEIIFDGIAPYSTNFDLMGEMAAGLILNEKQPG